MFERLKSNRDHLELFERKFVFRTARGYFIFLACLAILLFGGGVMLGARGLVRAEPEEPSPPALPAAPAAPTQLTLADVETWIHRQQNAPTSVTSDDEPEWVASARDEGQARQDPAQQRFDELLEQFKALFPAPNYSWKDTYTRTCTRQSPYGCLRYEQELEKSGVSKILEGAIRQELKRDSVDEVNAILASLIGVLKSTALEKRADFIAPSAEAYRELQSEYLGQLDAHEREIHEINQAHQRRVDEYELELQTLRAEKESDQTAGVYGVLAGLGLLVLVSVFLAHFAIERHLRLMREILATRS